MKGATLPPQTDIDPTGSATTASGGAAESIAMGLIEATNPRGAAADGSEQGSEPPGVPSVAASKIFVKESRLHVAVLVFDGVQDIDYAGPMEVFGQAGAKIFTVAATAGNVRSTFDINMQPDYDLDHAPVADFLLIPGGSVDSVTGNPRAMAWVRQQGSSARALMSVCTGAFILGEAGLLDGLSATTIAGATQALARRFPKARVVTDRRYVDNGRIITTGGLSAGIDGALHLVERELGRLRAEDVARGIEYEWRPDGSGSFGLLARRQIPDVASLLPVGASWKRVADRGDTKRWAISGHLQIVGGADEFLDASAITIQNEAWIPRRDKGGARRSFARTHEGRLWQFDLTLAHEPEPSTYLMTLAVKWIAAGKSTRKA